MPDTAYAPQPAMTPDKHVCKDGHDWHRWTGLFYDVHSCRRCSVSLYSADCGETWEYPQGHILSSEEFCDLMQDKHFSCRTFTELEYASEYADQATLVAVSAKDVTVRFEISQDGAATMTFARSGGAQQSFCVSAASDGVRLKAID